LPDRNDFSGVFLEMNLPKTGENDRFPVFLPSTMPNGSLFADLPQKARIINPKTRTVMKIAGSLS
jgi:hypothetical protein